MAEKKQAQQQRPRKTAEQITEIKVTKARERDAEVIFCNTTTAKMFAEILRNLDKPLRRFQMGIGVPGGTPMQEAIQVQGEIEEVLMSFNALTEKLNKRYDYRYVPPRGIRVHLAETGASEEEVEEGKTTGKKKESKAA